MSVILIILIKTITIMITVIDMAMPGSTRICEYVIKNEKRLENRAC